MYRVASTLRSELGALQVFPMMLEMLHTCICTPYSFDPDNSDALNSLNIFKRCFIFVKNVRRPPRSSQFSKTEFNMCFCYPMMHCNLHNNWNSTSLFILSKLCLIHLICNRNPECVIFKLELNLFRYSTSDRFINKYSEELLQALSIEESITRSTNLTI